MKKNLYIVGLDLANARESAPHAPIQAVMNLATNYEKSIVKIPLKAFMDSITVLESREAVVGWIDRMGENGI